MGHGSIADSGRSCLAGSSRRGWCAALFVLSVSGCGGSDGDYYYLATLRGRDDTLLLDFTFTCGQLDVSWKGEFVGSDPLIRTELAISHDNDGDECPDALRTVVFDLAPMKQVFRDRYSPASLLSLRIPPYNDRHGAVCLPDVFQVEPFMGTRCK